MSKLNEMNNKNKLSYELIWKIINNFITRNDGKELIKHQIESYDLFLHKYIPDIIKENNPFIVTKKINDDEKIIYHIVFDNISYGKPLFNDTDGKINIMYPKFAKERNLTYSMPLCIDLNLNIKHYKDDKIIDVNNTINKNEIIGYVPLMTGSKHCLTSDITYNKNIDKCVFDKGGYFIINGSDKVIISQERMGDNIPFVFKVKDKKHSHICEVRSNTAMTKIANVFKIKFISKYGIRGDRTLKVIFSNLKDDIPLFILFKMLGVKNDEEIIKYILGSQKNDKDYIDYIELLKPSIIEANKVLENEGAGEYIKKAINNKNMTLDFLIKQKVLGHIGTDDSEVTNKKKMFYIGHLTKKLLNVLLNKEKVSDRDNFINKRIETPGILMAQLFRKLYKNMIKSLKMSVLKETNKSLDISINKFIKKAIIENGLKFSLATGNWNAKIGVEDKKVGIAQVLNRLTFSATLSHLRRLNAPMGKQGKMVTPRKLHNSQYGFCCAAESPEGQSVGLVKNLALSTNVTTYSNPEPVKQFLIDSDVLLVSDLSPQDVSKIDTKIFINGIFFGITQNPLEIIDKLKSLRRAGKINYTTSISFKIKNNNIIILTDEGRLMRPFFIINKNKLNLTARIITKIRKDKISWIELINSGVIEFIDINEIETSMVAIKQEDLSKKFVNYTHCEIHASLILGVCASLIPFPEHNQSPRNVYQCAMGKQAIGINSTDVLNRMDTLNHLLHYPQKPIIYTRASDILGLNKMPAGDNLIVAIATHTGYNIEDSVIVNRGAIERGLFHTTFYRTYKTEEKKDMSALAEERFCVPDKDKCIGIRQGSYNNLDKNGIIKPETKVVGNDIIIGKMTPIINKSFSSKKNLKYKDTSVQLRHNEDGIVDRVELTHNNDGYRLAKVKIRSTRIPEIADKMCSRHGQKGTIGMILNEEDMPFTEDGICPDIIINPHAIPSRMTIAQLIECILGKVGSMEGRFFDGTPFENLDHNKLSECLSNNGFEKSGYETMYNAENGEQMKSQIFIGPTYYQRLKHMVKDKMHARARGPTSLITRQPTEGRSREGGLRLGKNCPSKTEKVLLVIIYGNISCCGKLLRVLNTTSIRKLLEGTRLIVVSNGNNFKNWTIRSVTF